MPDPSRIAEDLRGVTSGDVLSDAASRGLYATDGSLYEALPAVVVRPRVTADVSATLAYASENGVPVHARGAGSGMAGGAVGSGIVVDFSRYMRRLVADEGDSVVVQPGLTIAELNRRLAPSGRALGPEPANARVGTIGGAVSVNAGGPRRALRGSVGDAVAQMTVALASGESRRLDLASNNATPRSSLERSLESLLRAHGAAIEEYSPRGCVSVSGYALRAAAACEASDRRLGRLLIGSEATLGLFTELRLKVARTTPRRACGLFTFSSGEFAAQAGASLVGEPASACDLLDRRHVGLCRQNDPRFSVILPGDAEAILYVESSAETQSEADASLACCAELLRGQPDWQGDTLIAETDEDRRLFAELPAAVLPTLQALGGRRRATPGLEAISLPPIALAQFFRRAQEILKRRQVTASVFAHVLHGQVQIWPLLDLTTPGELRRLETLASDLYDTVWLLGGSITGTGGDGLSRTPFVSRQHGPLVNVFREVKRLFDPAGVLNPGKIVPIPGARMTHATRYRTVVDASSGAQAARAEPSKKTVPLQLEWTSHDALAAAAACNGCGDCRRNDAATRMCPIFRYTPREEASPRAKANLLRGVLGGSLPVETLATDAARDVADLCVNCHQCRLECPASVDIPRMMLEAKASHIAQSGMRFDAWWCSRIDPLAAVMGRFPRVANVLMTRPWFRWAMERLTGLSAVRRLPQLAGRSFLASATARPLRKPASHSGDRVAYFVDTFANRFDTELAEAFVAVLRRHDIAVYTPPGQSHSGMAMISQGGVEVARSVAEKNVALLAEAVRQGHTIVATEPSAALALTHEYRVLLPNDEDAALVAANTEEACAFLWRRHLNAKLSLDLAPIPLRLAYHQPCHSRAINVGAPAEKLLRLIPDLRVERLDKGCSGMAGTYGLLRRNYRSSLRAGLPMLNAFRRGSADAGATECSTCRLQMEQNAPAPTLHPIKLLAASYGYLPRVRAQIDALVAADGGLLVEDR